MNQSQVACKEVSNGLAQPSVLIWFMPALSRLIKLNLHTSHWAGNIISVGQAEGKPDVIGTRSY